jgi:hypothetical protein
MGMRALRWFSVAAAGLALLVPASSLARHREPGSPWTRPPVVVLLHWRTIADNVSYVVAAGSYVAFDSGSGLTPAMLLDQRTGRVTVFPGCEDPLLGGARLIMTCSQGTTEQFRLVTLATGAIQTVPFPAGCTSSNGCAPFAVGAYWFGVLGPEPDCIEHCTVPVHYQNLYTGQTTTASPGPNSYVDLNSPKLVRNLCQPLHLPNFDSVTVYGQLAVYQPASLSSDQAEYLERCGSRQQHSIGVPGYLTANPRTMIWQSYGSGRSVLVGVRIPNLRRLRFTGFPRRGSFAALGAHTAYALITDPSKPPSEWELAAASLPPND